MTASPERYKVEFAGKARSQLEELKKRAKERGLRGLLAAVLRQMLENLETRPKEWGDPYNNYRGLNAVAMAKRWFRRICGLNIPFTTLSRSFGFLHSFHLPALH